MLAATQQGFCIQKYAHRWIYIPIRPKVRGCSLADGVWVMCSMTAVLKRLPSPSVHRLKFYGFSHVAPIYQRCHRPGHMASLPLCVST
jgi:hypothetical protein